MRGLGCSQTDGWLGESVRAAQRSGRPRRPWLLPRGWVGAGLTGRALWPATVATRIIILAQDASLSGPQPSPRGRCREIPHLISRLRAPVISTSFQAPMSPLIPNKFCRANQPPREPNAYACCHSACDPTCGEEMRWRRWSAPLVCGLIPRTSAGGTERGRAALS